MLIQFLNYTKLTTKCYKKHYKRCTKWCTNVLYTSKEEDDRDVDKSEVKINIIRNRTGWAVLYRYKIYSEGRNV